MAERNSLYNLPTGWSSVSIKDVIEKIPLTGKKVKQRDYQTSGSLPIIDQGRDYIGGYSNLQDIAVHSDSPLIIFGDHTKAIKYVDFDFIAGADGVKVIKPLEMWYPKFFYYLLHNVELPDKGYARHFQFLEKAMVPVPPLEEQHRIVAKIEELFTNLDAGVEALKKIQAQIKRYRQAVLKSAFEGKLTEEWREARKDKLEPASVLLKRMREERKEKLGGKYKEPPPVDTSELPELPDGWEWTRMSNLCLQITDGVHKTPSYTDDGIPFLSVNNLKNNHINFDGCKYISEEEHLALIKRCKPEKGDLLLGKVGSIGVCDVIKTEREFSIFVQLALLKPVLPLISSTYIKRAILDSQTQNQIAKASGGTALKYIGIGKIQLLTIPVASPEESQLIVEEIERRFSIADHIEMVVEQSILQSDRLRQSILTKAFEGRLVPQDPNDKPAELLLERIKKEREKQTVEVKKVRSKKGR